ncbi:TetR family transcriptional regulator [Arthrobacter sp. LAPM80]|uniref:TetR/AcrR family transcriptional regulator n=1 Tax=Arthrobacter sp. LAPM80 TaxID=3141788 RepID=UPI00398B2E3C
MPVSHSASDPAPRVPVVRKAGRRAVQAADTRAHIISIAGRLFLQHGYVVTTIEAIARESGVALQTIYNSVGNKAAVLSAVLDAAASGLDSPMSVLELMRKRTADAADLDSLITVLTDWFVDVHHRIGPVMDIIAQAAAVDSVVEKLQKDRALQRLERYAEAAAAVRSRGGLTSGMSDADAAAAIWSLGHPQGYRTLVTDAGWSVPAYRDWLRRSLSATLA